MKIENTNLDKLYKSSLVNLFNWTIINDKNIKPRWVTLPNTNIIFYDNNWNILSAMKSNKYWFFEANFILPNDWIFKVKFYNNQDEYIKNYKINFDINYINSNIITNNYFQNFNNINNVKIIDWK